MDMMTSSSSRNGEFQVEDEPNTDGMSLNHLVVSTINGSAFYVPSGKHTKNYGKSPFLMGQSTISMDHFQ